MLERSRSRDGGARTAAATAASDQVVDLQVALQDVVLDGVEDEADVVGVGGAGEVRVDDLLLVGVEAGKRVQNEGLGRFHVLPGTWGRTSRGSGHAGSWTTQTLTVGLRNRLSNCCNSSEQRGKKTQKKQKGI